MRPAKVAVVLGGGIAGLAAAAALRCKSIEVLLVERDGIPVSPTKRRGLPQGNHLHNLLARSQMHLDELLPGFVAALKDEGCGDAGVADETHVWELGGIMPLRSFGFRVMCAERSLIEHVARQLLLRRSDVEIRDRTNAVGIVVDRIGSVAAVRVESPAGTTELRADIVVDATGGTNQADRWLRELGGEVPRRTVFSPYRWYASVVVKRPTHARASPDFWLAIPYGECTRGAVVSPIGSDRWLVSVNGTGSDPAPRTYDDMLAHLASLEDDFLRRVVDGATPAGDLFRFRRTEDRWLHYEELSHPLLGFLPIGDAVATPYPLFGLGMSVAAWQAATMLETIDLSSDLDRVTTEHHRATATISRQAWKLCHGGVEELEKKVGAPGRLLEMIKDDAAFHERYVRVLHLLEPLETLYPGVGCAVSSGPGHV